MFIHAATLLVALQSAPAIEPATQLTYEGIFLADKGEPIDTQKKFTVTWLVVESGAGGSTVYWSLAEDGRGAWSWLDRFGKMKLDPKGVGESQAAPALLYERDDEGYSVVPIIPPLVARELASDSRWREGRLTGEVTGTSQVKGTPAWTVEVGGLAGRRRLLKVAKDDQRILTGVERVFIGQGEQYELQYDLKSSERLSAARLQAAIATFDGLLKLRDGLEFKPRSIERSLSDEQLALLTRELPALAERADGALGDVTKRAVKETRERGGRSNALAALRTAAIGKSPGEFTLPAVRGESLTDKQLRDRVSVLHFWSYKDTPLEEPYGQIGYLDFLRRNNKDVQVFGIAVNNRVSDPSTRRSAVNSARKLISFMNLSYPIMLDEGSLIKKIGDPRLTGAKLPLFVVVGPDGKVIHYHVGYYEVDRARGLKELEEVVRGAKKG